mmetsp:Transcript_10007/g.14430  ORF Transcript_10007/g.14430 Transcript_10007/m.14430 type:complete len:153 (-) Transcript_10007:1427-1885(-)
MERWHERDAKIYLEQQHKFSDLIFGNIHWTSLRFVLKKLSPHRRATAVKALHRHLPTQEKLFKQGRVAMTSTCPRCVTWEETNAHIYCCMNDKAFKQRKADWVELWKQLHRTSMATMIEQTWRYYLQPLVAIPLGESIVDIFQSRMGMRPYY